MVILQRSRDDLGGGRRGAVHQHHHRHRLHGPGKLVEEVVLEGAAHVIFLGGGEAHLGVVGASVGVDHEGVLRQERRGYRDRGVEEPARIQAQVEDEALQVAVGLLVEVVQGHHQVLAGVLLELRDADEAVARLEHPRLHALHLDHVAAHDDLERLLLVLAHDGELHVGVGLAAHLLHGVGEADALQRHFVELDDEIARLHPGAICRRVFDGRDHLHETVLGADLDAEAAEFALGADLKVAIGFLVEERGMRVEAGEHAVDGFLQQLLVFDGLDVVALDAAEHFTEEPQVVDRQHECRSLAIRDRGEMQARRDAERRAECHQTHLLKLLAHSKSSRSRQWSRRFALPARVPPTPTDQTVFRRDVARSIDPIPRYHPMLLHVQSGLRHARFRRPCAAARRCWRRGS